MLVFVTTSADSRFVIYLKTNICQIIYSDKELSFESTLDKLVTMKDFLLNFGINQIELRENKSGNGRGALIIRDNLVMQLDDRDSIRGLAVPVLTII